MKQSPTPCFRVQPRKKSRHIVALSYTSSQLVSLLSVANSLDQLLLTDVAHTAPFMQQNGIQSFDPSQTTSNSSLHLVLRPRTQPIATETNQDQPANVTNPQQIPSYGQSCETSLFERVSSNSYFGSESTALQNQVYSQEETTPVGNSQQQHTFLNDTAFNWSPASDGHLEMNPTAFSMINTMSNSGMESSQDTSHFPMMPWGEQWMPIADPSNGIGSDGGWYTLFSD